MDVRFLPTALKDLKGLAATDRARIIAKIEQYVEQLTALPARR
ncbi:MAG: hypothetical protein RLY86_2644 [Pseudomonadota bacterium]|jgi:mRNA-degrading endonuclease RelE of RelBE toxin-antitoxin system